MELAITGNNTDRFRDLAADSLKEELEDLKGVKDTRFVGFSPRAFNKRDSRKNESLSYRFK